MKHLEEMRVIAKAITTGKVVSGDAVIVAAVKKHLAAEKEFEKLVMRSRVAYGMRSVLQ